MRIQWLQWQASEQPAYQMLDGYLPAILQEGGVMTLIRSDPSPHCAWPATVSWSPRDGVGWRGLNGHNGNWNGDQEDQRKKKQLNSFWCFVCCCCVILLNHLVCGLISLLWTGFKPGKILMQSQHASLANDVFCEDAHSRAAFPSIRTLC